MAHIRTYQELLNLEPTPAEQHLIQTAQAGETCILGDGSLPAADADETDRRIRADILRYLILGGCDACKVDDVGVWLQGAHITEVLDLNFHTVQGAIGLRNCRFDGPLDMVQMRCEMLDINGSDIRGLNGQGIQIVGTAYLRRVTSSNVINFIGARIGGQLSCIGAQISAPAGFALSAQSAEINGGIFLHPRVSAETKDVDAPFHAQGGVILAGATTASLYAAQTTLIASPENNALNASGLVVRGNVRLDGCTASGEMKLSGARVTGSLHCKNMKLDNAQGHAFNGQRMKVSQAFAWRGEHDGQGAISLNGAHVAELDDDPTAWPQTKDKLLLDGFTYDRIRGKVSTSPARDRWLKNGSLYKDQFFPQPYTEYAAFLRNTGHDSEARRVLLQRERMMRKYERTELRPLRRAWRYLTDGLQLVVVGHGHAPFWSLGWLALLITLAAIPAHFTWEEGSFAPNSAPVLVSDYWQSLQTMEPNPSKVWAGDLELTNWSPPDPDTLWQSRAPGRDWETFNRYAYAADIVIPLINFGQTDAWSPSTTRGPWGWHLWWLRWVFIVFGWIVTALGAAAITGIIRRE